MRLNELDSELIQYKNKLGERTFKKFMRFFRNVSKNPAEPIDSLVFLTQESLDKKLKNHFGHKCGLKKDFLANRLYYILSDHVNLKRIHFKDFLDKIYNPLWEGSFRD